MRNAFEGFGDRVRAIARPWEVAVFIWIPALALAYAFQFELRTSSRLQDFGIFRSAAKSILDGRSPFPAPTAAALAGFDKFVYPPATALFFTPFAELPLELGQVLMLVLGVVCVFLALRLFDVRDWRCYGLAAMSAPAVNSLALGAVTSFLLVGIAAAWRYRGRPNVTGPLVGLVAVAKLFLWPLGLWLLVTRRLRATLLAASTAIVLVVAGWGAIGFAGFRTYPRLLRELSKIEEGTSYSPVALFHLTGRPAGLLTAALAVAVAAAVALAARGADGDRRALAVAVVGSLVATPVVWLHYFLLLLVPLALYRPRFSPVWLAPLLLWLAPTTHSHGVTWQIALVLGVAGLVTVRTTAERQTRWLVRWIEPLRGARARRSLGESV